MKNEILDELWAAKDEIGKACKYDVKALAESLRRKPYKIERPKTAAVAEKNKKRSYKQLIAD